MMNKIKNFCQVGKIALLLLLPFFLIAGQASVARASFQIRSDLPNKVSEVENITIPVDLDIEEEKIVEGAKVPYAQELIGIIPLSQTTLGLTIAGVLMLTWLLLILKRQT